ncbi:hypothetical protein L6452_17637 [Arctium lappa]|uniref:Uncharacterized protein n=1 Tax=Arctium lappa TaxID=4217 RepID=A0ACB9C3Z2_ARCLA|nr:hypothetical protein L6452_17637 [Arctium lappa]
MSSVKEGDVFCGFVCVLQVGFFYVAGEGGERIGEVGGGEVNGGGCRSGGQRSFQGSIQFVFVFVYV